MGILGILPAVAGDQHLVVVVAGNAVLELEKTMMLQVVVLVAVALVAVAMNMDLKAVTGCVVVIEKEVSIWHFVVLLGFELNLDRNPDL